MMLYLGLDVHSKWFTVAGFVKETGEAVKVPRVLNDPAAIAAVFATLPAPRCGALEAGTNALALHRLLQPYFAQLLIVAPNQVWDRRRTTGAKTDLRDAWTLAEELSLGRLHGIYLPEDALRDARQVGRGRVQLTQERTRQVNQLYALLRSWGTPIEKKLLTHRGRQWVETVTLPPWSALLLEQALARLDALQAQEAVLEAQIAAFVHDDPICQLLATIPCVGPLTALLLRTEIGDIARFASADRLVAYTGLQPRVYQSSDQCRYGGLTKHGNSYLRYIAVVFAQNAIRSRQDTPFKRRFYRLCHTHHPNEIKIMLARDFLAVVHSMWRHQTAWHWTPAPPTPAPSFVA